MVRRLLISRFMRVSDCKEVGRTEVAKRWRPLSFMPGRFSRRSDFRYGGSALRARFVKVDAEIEEIERWRSEGIFRNVPIMERNVRELLG